LPFFEVLKSAEVF
jgi:hypothetical protein